MAVVDSCDVAFPSDCPGLKPNFAIILNPLFEGSRVLFERASSRRAASWAARSALEGTLPRDSA